jgi:hypothetical protein
MAMRLTHERLIEVLSYDPRSGQMTWKVRLSTIRKAGDVAGGSYGSYSFVTVDKVMYLAHRLCWFYVTGTWPSGEIDHINGIPTDNRWCNLRVVEPRTNQQNMRRAHFDSATGLLGVSKHGRAYRYQIKVCGKNITRGGFRTPEDAHAAYVEAKRAMHEGCTL